MIHILLKLLFAAPPLKRQLTVLHQEPHHLDAVEFRAVRWQEFQRYPQLLQQFGRWLDRASSMDQRVAEHDHHRLADLPRQLGHKAQEDLDGAATPAAGMHPWPLLNNAAITFRRWLRGASMQCCSPQDVHALRLGWTCAKPASSKQTNIMSPVCFWYLNTWHSFRQRSKTASSRFFSNCGGCVSTSGPFP